MSGGFFISRKPSAISNKIIYESFGVREYWLVNLKKNTLNQYLNHDGEFTPKKVHQKTDVLRADTLTGFELPLDNVL